MNLYKADLHTHTVLSPCGDLEMSPISIVEKAKREKIDILGITDHNSTKNCKVLDDIAKDNDIFILKGAEVASKEEVHCLAFFDKYDELNEFQYFLDDHLPKIKNDVNKFGYQLVLDSKENILEQIEYLLISGLNIGISEIETKVHELNGLFIPAHIDRMRYSIISQLGFVPNDLNVDALEISKHTIKKEFIQQNNYLADYCFIQSSDAHFLEDIGNVKTIFQMNDKSFNEVKLALKEEAGRKVMCNE
ncbi:MAG: PHP domain-containing protein [Bacteroidales bacterium]|nr:PHP domain-containing protein [Bacteroidales bacterium]